MIRPYLTSVFGHMELIKTAHSADKKMNFIFETHEIFLDKKK